MGMGFYTHRKMMIFLYFYLIFYGVLGIIGLRTLCEKHSRCAIFVSKSLNLADACGEDNNTKKG